MWRSWSISALTCISAGGRLGLSLSPRIKAAEIQEMERPSWQLRPFNTAFPALM